jgi:hypothetical protein
MTGGDKIDPRLLLMPRDVTAGPGGGVLVAPRDIEQRILFIRGHRVMLDRDLAELYGVATKTLNQAVARNVVRFPLDFSFYLTPDEAATLRSQSVTSKGRGGQRHAPRVFTEQGVAMLSSVLRSRRAVDVNIAIMRAFVHLRELLATHKDLARKLEELERKYDGKFALVFDAIRELMTPSPEREIARPRIGFIREPASAVRAYELQRSGNGRDVAA